MDLDHVREVAAHIRGQIGRAVLGQESSVDLLLAALLSQGHVLLEGMPGTAKTLLARSLAAALRLEFRRIQFTPDLMPGDVTGTNLFDFRTHEFHLAKGPVFTQILLADEINRTPPKTQAALLEAMQERTVTLDGTRHDLGDGFFVIATQNPIEQEGTYPLPEAQLDRFLFKIPIGYPGRDAELDLVRLHGHRGGRADPSDCGIEPQCDLEFLRASREAVRDVELRDEILAYLVDLVRATREHPSLRVGASPRAANMIATAARARAVLDGRDYVIPDDVKELALPVLAHRVVISPAAEIDEQTSATVVEQIVKELPAPR